MEEKYPTIDELMARKRKLTELREIKLKSSRKRINQMDGNDEYSAPISNAPISNAPISNAPISNEPISISPLTPLMLKQTQKHNREILGDPNLATPLSQSSLLRNDDPLSPFPLMSPATEELYNVLITDPKLQFDSTDIIENSEVSEENDSDDSVRDPDFNIKKIIIDDSATDCESCDDEKETPENVSMDNTQNKETGSSTCVTNENTGKQSVSPEMNMEEDIRDTEYAAPTIDEIEIPTMIVENTIDRNENVTLIMETPSTSEENTNNNTKKRRSRVERNASKTLRNTGKSYKTEKGKVVPDRKPKELISCRLKCVERFTKAEQTQCFENYWQLGDRDRRAAFVCKSVEILPKNTQKTGSRALNREYYCKYMLEIYNENKPVCKECFCKILGETKGFVNIIIEKKKLSPNGIIDEDQRGRQPPKNKKTIEDISLVNHHILSFPSYESHYCRNSTGKKYLAADLSIAKMYREYKNTSSNPVSLKLYSKCFHDLNLSFKQPSKDTCNTCDVLNAKIKVADEDRKVDLSAELVEHQHQAEKAYAEKRVDKENAKDDSSVRVFAFDLQQCLPTPYLKTSVSFYKRQLWSFNLTIHDLATNEATCYMWDETIGARGANQIASCLWHFCNSLPSEVKELIFYSDTCGGQNKNNVVAMMFMFLLNNHPTLQKINHKFLLSGHTHMECDSDHAIIEKTKKRTQMRINHLYDWVQLVRTCKVQKPFKVVVMTVNDFLDFTELKSKKGPFTLKKLDDSGDKFLWQPIKWLQYDKSSVGKMYFKKTLDREPPFKLISLRKRGKTTIDIFNLSQISKEALPISAEKKKDLMDMIDLIDDSFKEFYIKIKTVGDVSASNDPDLDEDNPDEEDFEVQ